MSTWTAIALVLGVSAAQAAAGRTGTVSFREPVALMADAGLAPALGDLSRPGHQATKVQARFGAMGAAQPSTETRSKLEDIRWRLVQLGDRRVTAEPGPREPHLRFNGATSRVQGATGCNSVGGGYTVKGETLTFMPLVATRMQCGKDMDVEAGLLKALGETKAWRIAQGRLELLDDKGRVLAQFEAPADK